jgi:hypothetical protein
MVFKTRWGPTSATDAIEKIIKQEKLPYNVHQKVEVTPGSKGDYWIQAKSVNGFHHNTGGYFHVMPGENGLGSVITVEGDSNTSEHEARDLEEKTREEYFKD